MAKRPQLHEGDYFDVLLPCKNADEPQVLPAFGQILSIETGALNSVACAFWPESRLEPNSILRSPPLAVHLVTPDLLWNKEWAIRGNSEILVSRESRPYEAYRKAGWVGCKVIGSSNIRALLRAYRGLEYWDDWADPRYLDNLLSPGFPRPSHAKFKRGA